MSKKLMLLALAVVSASLLALPAMASAQSMVVDVQPETTFTGSGGPGFLEASEEPKITCEKTTVPKTTMVGGEVQTVTLEFEECHIVVLGATIKCKSSGSAIDNKIVTTNKTDYITVNNKAAVLVTPPFPTIVCGSGLTERKIQIDGEGIIGTVTTPATCNKTEELTSIKLSFNAKAGTQEDELYTTKPYDLEVTTEGSATKHTGALEGSATITATKSFTMTCQ